jgi:hypothetical protein
MEKYIKEQKDKLQKRMLRMMDKLANDNTLRLKIRSHL